MGFQKRYNWIISRIEEAVSNNEKEIPEKLAKETGTNLRLIADAFQFITGITLSQYIKQRRLLQALAYKQRSDCSLETAAADYGFADTATMSKAFKNCFGTSPSRMSKEKLEQYAPFTLEVVLAGGCEQAVSPMVSSDETQEIFGIDRKKFQSIKEAIELNAAYGLSDEEVGSAYDLSQKHEVSLSKAFEFLEDLKLQEENGTLASCGWNVTLGEITTLYFKRDLSVSESIEECCFLHSIGVEDVSELDDDFLTVFFSEGYTMHNFCAEEIEELLTLLRESGISAEEFDDVMMDFDGDIMEAIARYVQFNDWVYWDSIKNKMEVLDEMEADYFL